MSEHRLYIRHCLLHEFIQGRNAAQAMRNICTYVCPKAVSYSAVKYWFERFRQKDFNLEDTLHPDQTPQIKINRLRELVEANPTRTTRSLGKELSISHATVKRYLNRFGMEFDSGFWTYSVNSKQDYMAYPTSTASYNYQPSTSSTSSVSSQNSTIQWQSNYYYQN